MKKKEVNTDTKKDLMIKSKVIYESKINWFGAGRILGVFIIAFFITFYITIFIYRRIINRIEPMTNKKIKKISLKVAKPKYNYFESKKSTIDPVIVKELIDSKEKAYIIIDTRSEKEYEQSHIKGAVNIPSYEDAKNVYQSLTNFSAEFSKKRKLFIGKRLVVVYGYHPEADLMEDCVHVLKKTKINTRILNVSWYEWQSNFYSWMPLSGLQSFSINNYLEGKEIEIFQQQ